MNNFRVKIEGLSDVRKAIASIPAEYRSIAEFQVIGSGAKVIAQKATELVPVGKGKDAGLLKNSIGFNTKGRPGERQARIGPRSAAKVQVGVKTKGKKKGDPIYKRANRYSHLVEYGSAHAPAKPFIQTAIAGAGPAVIDAMSRGMEKALVRISKKIARGKR